MKLLIVSTAPFIYKSSSIYAYSPYVNELIVFEKFADKITPRIFAVRFKKVISSSKILVARRRKILRKNSRKI